MKKIIAIFVLALAVLAFGHPADAQKPGKVWKIGFLTHRSGPWVEVGMFRQGLRQLGYVEGKNIAIKFQYANGQDRLPTLAAELVHLKVDVIVTVALPSTRAAMSATRTIPIVFISVGDPVGQGVITSLARPGGNVTGLVFRTPGLMGKKLEFLRETVPHASRVAVLWNRSRRGHRARLKEIEAAGRGLGLRFQILGMRGPEEFESAFAAMTRERADALLVLVDRMLRRHRKRIANLAAKHRLPAMYGFRAHVESGGLMAYMPDRPRQFLRAATYVDKILKGANPADLPAERPVKFELVINLKAAKRIGLTIPPEVLLQATKVIK